MHVDAVPDESVGLHAHENLTIGQTQGPEPCFRSDEKSEQFDSVMHVDSVPDESVGLHAHESSDLIPTPVRKSMGGIVKDITASVQWCDPDIGVQL